MQHRKTHEVPAVRMGYRKYVHAHIPWPRHIICGHIPSRRHNNRPTSSSLMDKIFLQKQHFLLTYMRIICII